MKSKPPRPERETPKVTRLVLIRHAEVETRYQKTFGGKIDMDLSPRGHEQARVLAGFLRAKEIAAVYASPMKRVRQTLAPFLNNGAPPATVLPDLREVDFGDWTGMNWERVCRKFNLLTHDWLEHVERGVPPNGENGAQFRARVEPCLRHIIKKHPSRTVAVFCHGGVIRMILAILLKIPLARTNMFEIEYAGVSQIALYPSHAEIELLNFTPWREALVDSRLP